MHIDDYMRIYIYILCMHMFAYIMPVCMCGSMMMNVYVSIYVRVDVHSLHSHSHSVVRTDLNISQKLVYPQPCTIACMTCIASYGGIHRPCG